MVVPATLDIRATTAIPTIPASTSAVAEERDMANHMVRDMGPGYELVRIPPDLESVPEGRLAGMYEEHANSL